MDKSGDLSNLSAAFSYPRWPRLVRKSMTYGFVGLWLQTLQEHPLTNNFHMLPPPTKGNPYSSKTGTVKIAVRKWRKVRTVSGSSWAEDLPSLPIIAFGVFLLSGLSRHGKFTATAATGFKKCNCQHISLIHVDSCWCMLIHGPIDLYNIRQ
jgi:hypothetical protein